MAEIRLISTDFDGTLVPIPQRGRCHPALAGALVEYKHSGCLWAINTGRSMEQMQDGLAAFQPPFLPDFLILNERHIFRANGTGWESLDAWNHQCDAIHARLARETAEILLEIEEHAADRGDFDIIRENGDIAGLVTHSEEVMDRVVQLLAGYRTTHPDFDFQRNSVYLRFSHRSYSKGTALGEVARLSGLQAEQIFCAGDNHNDIPMLDGSCARWVACPVNAVDEVKRTVRQSSGFVSAADSALGTAEALEYFAALHGRGNAGKIPAAMLAEA